MVCGRFTLAVDDWGQLLQTYGVANFDFYHIARYNIAPTQDVVAILSDGKERRAGLLRWSLIPSWSETEKTSFATFNARSETLLTKPTFKGLVERKRCVILADSFYEWKRTTKKPLRIRLRKQNVFSFAGLYDVWYSPQGQKVGSCTIITCRPNEFMNPIHDRMPVILSREAEDEWLDRTITNPAQVMNHLRPFNGEMYSYPVSDLVGNVKYDSFHLALEDKSTGEGDRHAFFRD